MATRIPDNRARFTLQEVAQACGGTAVGGDPDLQLQSVLTDSRRVGPGALFVALRGENFDAHRFLDQVHAAGASAALIEKGTRVPAGLATVVVADTLRALGDLAAFHRKRWGGRLVGITGSAGKTTTKELTHAALCMVSDSGERAVARTEGNLNNLIGVPMTLFTLESQHQTAVVEMGTSAPGEIARLAEIASPQVGVVTSVAAAHAEGLGSVEGVAREKAALLRALPDTGTAIYNLDCPELVAEVQTITCRKLSFGQSEQADFRLLKQDITAGMQGALAALCSYRVPGDNAPLEAPLAMLGQGPAVDAAAALAVVHALLDGSAVQAAVAGLGRVAPVSGRMCPVQGPGGCLLLDDSYNANPASVHTSLRSLAALARKRGGRAFAVLGDMKELGALTADEHTAVGQACVKLRLDGLVTMGESMRGALHEAKQGGVAFTLDAASSQDAAHALLPMLAPSDVVLVKGSRSMAMEQVVEQLAVGAVKS